MNPSVSSTSLLATPALRWDIFCQVIDNHGDLGVCWRLSTDLAQRGHSVRLWVDEPSALAWMAPSGCPSVQVLPWTDALQAKDVGDVVVEAFGCTLSTHTHDLLARSPRTVWINLEYLSAESYVARNHGLSSPVMQGPARGANKWFFYPGFTHDTGGLLREPDLPTRQTRFARDEWLAQLTRASTHVPPLAAGECLISLFCYEPRPLAPWLAQLSQNRQRTRLLVTSGRAQAAVHQACHQLGWSITQGQTHVGALRISPLPYLTQTDYDHLLWACDLNFVRGEDSLVRALWAARPFVWHIYPQDDFAHHAKLEAFCDSLQMPPDLHAWHKVWNGIQEGPLLSLSRARLDDWTRWSHGLERSLQSQSDLCSQLLGFVAQKR